VLCCSPATPFSALPGPLQSADLTIAICGHRQQLIAGSVGEKFMDKNIHFLVMRKLYMHTHCQCTLLKKFYVKISVHLKALISIAGHR
jgi:hypothetical protein